MKLKKLISTALTLVLVFSVFALVLPTRVDAAYSSETDTGRTLSSDEIKEVVNGQTAQGQASDKYIGAINYNFGSAQQMLEYELEKGLLLSAHSAGNAFSIYANRYTGVVYYVNNTTGQILTTNPYDVGGANVEQEQRMELMSQLSIAFFSTANSTEKYDYNSTKWSALYSQINVTPISDGLRVNYTLGDSTARFLLPARITAARFEEYILIPMLRQYEELLEEYCRERFPEANFSFFENEETYLPYVNGCINSATAGVRDYANDMRVYYPSAAENSAARKALDELSRNLVSITQAYSLKNPNNPMLDEKTLAKMHEDYPITVEGIALYEYDMTKAVAQKRATSRVIMKYCRDYTYSMMYADEKECGYEGKEENKPLFRCALEYTFNSDGTLSVRLPANSITFDETKYTLVSVTPLKYFGAGDMNTDGYIFFPDGSGTVVEFEDFYKGVSRVNLSLSSQIYGQDFCYSEITGAHREQVTMPVYGVVTGTAANPITSGLYGTGATVQNGYFAILEEGAALASIGFQSGGAKHKYASAFASYAPYPSDKFDLSETLSVGALGEYYIVSESKYNGSYVTRIVMLCDEQVGTAAYGAGNFYPPTYVGMAACYRDYLKANGTLTALTAVEENLPLYIEVLGSMEIVERILTFPVTKSIALTSFEDIELMYSQLSTCRDYLKTLAQRYRDEAAEQEDPATAATYVRLAEEYEALSEEVINITNINFRLNGFSSGGMYATYPTRVRWERACGGANGFNHLTETAAAASAKDGYHFGVYPEFDFQYISNTSLLDGISVRGNVSRMVDNRYASRQVYSSVYQMFITGHGDNSPALVISPDALDRLYTKFEKQYRKYDITSISVSTLGSELNSNFDEENPINRDDAQAYVSALLDRMANTSGYDVMIDAGNIYAVKYASHILNISTDSSHFRYSSYAVPFIGMVLHGYVNYAGSPLNYSGTPAYDMLRAIENGASIYYLLCYENAAYLKEDDLLSQYYGVNYENWFSDIAQAYTELNAAIGDLQTYGITDHRTLIAERVIDEDEFSANLIRLQEELATMFYDQMSAKIDAAFDEMRADDGNIGRGVRVQIDRAALIAQACEVLNADVSEIPEFVSALDAHIAYFEGEYRTYSDNPYVVSFDAVEYESQYRYLTDSFARDDDYVYTDYTCDNGNVVMVTYSDGEHTVHFLLNYNVYAVTVQLDAEHSYTLGRYEYIRIDE